MILSLGYLYFYQAIEKDTYLYHKTILNQEKLTYDRIFSKVITSVDTVYRNSNVSSLSASEAWKATELFQVVDLNLDLKRIMNENDDAVSSIGVYFYHDGCFVTNKNRYAEKIIPVYLNKLHISLEEFLKRTSQVSGYFLIPNKKEQNIIFYRNIYNEEYTEVTGVAFVVVPWSKIKNIADMAVLSDKSGTVLINKEEEVIGNSNTDINVSDIHYNLYDGDYDENTIRLNRADYITSSLQSDILDIRYCIYTPKSVFYKKVNIIKIGAVLEFLISIIAGILLSKYFAGKNYSPIERILSLLDMRQDEMKNSSTAHNYEVLENTLQGLFKNKVNLEKQLSMRDARIKENVLSSVLKGRNLNESWATDYVENLKHYINFSRYRIVLFSFGDIENHSFFKEKMEMEDRIYTYSLLLFTVKNVIDEAMLLKAGKIHKKGITMEIDDMVACIVPIDEEENDGTLMEDVSLSIRFLKDAFQIPSYAAISGIHDSWEDLSAAYEEALLSVIHKNFWDNEIEDIIIYDKELLLQQGKFNENLLLEQGMKLSNCLATRDYKKASAMLDDILDSCFSKDISKLVSNQSQAVFIVELILNNLKTFELENRVGEKVKEERSTYFDNLNYPEHLFRVKSIKSLKEEIHNILDEIAVRYEEQIKSEEPEWLQKVKDYVEENYCDSDINISVIADKFDMTLSHMGKVFRKFTGISMLDHIHFLRISKCKELLSEGMTIKDCAKETGYMDSKALIRAFKRYEGITPGQFKSNIGNVG